MHRSRRIRFGGESRNPAPIGRRSLIGVVAYSLLFRVIGLALPRGPGALHDRHAGGVGGAAAPPRAARGAGFRAGVARFITRTRCVPPPPRVGGDHAHSLHLTQRRTVQALSRNPALSAQRWGPDGLACEASARSRIDHGERPPESLRLRHEARGARLALGRSAVPDHEHPRRVGSRRDPRSGQQPVIAAGKR